MKPHFSPKHYKVYFQYSFTSKNLRDKVDVVNGRIIILNEFVDLDQLVETERGLVERNSFDLDGPTQTFGPFQLERLVGFDENGFVVRQTLSLKPKIDKLNFWNKIITLLPSH